MFKKSDFHVDRNLIYKTIEQKKLTIDIYTPNQAGKKPAVIVVHGGGWSSRTGDMSGICEDLANAGFVALNITYRLAPRDLFPQPEDDVKDAITWVKDHASEYDIDPARISGWGYSAGAHLILMAGLDPKMGLKSMVVGGTPAKLIVWPDSPLIKAHLGASYKENPKLWEEASPINHVEKNSPGVFMYHGAWDQLVEADQMNFMEQALKAKKIPVETFTVRYMGHMAVYLFSRESINRGIEFLQKK